MIRRFVKWFFPGVVALLACVTASSTTPWVPRDRREELAAFEDIVEAEIVEEDGPTRSPPLARAGTCSTTYAAAAVTRVLKGNRGIEETILLGGLPKIQANFPLTRGNRYVLFLQKDVSDDLDDERDQCPNSALLQRASAMKGSFAGVYTGYHDFAIGTANGKATVAVWGYKGNTGWLFLEGYAFDERIPDSNRGGTLFITSYEKFVSHVQRMLAEAASAPDK